MATADVWTEIVIDTTRVRRALERAAFNVERFGQAWARSLPGHRRHGAIKHARDLRRARAKRLVALLREGHDLERAPGTVCRVCASPPNAEHVLRTD